MDTFPKFIVEGDRLIIGRVSYHRQLAENHENVRGGGWWRRDSAEKKIVLYNSSDQFGRATIEDIQNCLDKDRVYSNKFSSYPIFLDHTFCYDTGTEIVLLKRKFVDSFSLLHSTVEIGTYLLESVPFQLLHPSVQFTLEPPESHLSSLTLKEKKAEIWFISSLQFDELQKISHSLYATEDEGEGFSEEFLSQHPDYSSANAIIFKFKGKRATIRFIFDHRGVDSKVDTEDPAEAVEAYKEFIDRYKELKLNCTT